MLGRTLLGLLVGIVAGMLYPPLARGDIYTWVDGAGVTNVSNLPPPEGVRTSNVARAAPNDPAREAALREAARESEMRALNERVQQLQAEVEQSRREIATARGLHATTYLLCAGPGGTVRYRRIASSACLSTAFEWLRLFMG